MLLVLYIYFFSYSFIFFLILYNRKTVLKHILSIIVCRRRYQFLHIITIHYTHTHTHTFSWFVVYMRWLTSTVPPPITLRIYTVYTRSMMMSANVRALYLPILINCKPLQLMADIRVPIIYKIYNNNNTMRTITVAGV